MPTYNVHLDITGIMVVDARNPDEAKKIALEDTLRGMDGVYEIGDAMIKFDFIDVAEHEDGDAMIFRVGGTEETFQCPNCDAWGYDVVKAFCKVCDD